MATSKASISIGAKDETGAAFNSVQRSIQKLQLAAATQGKSAREAKLYELGLQGASKAQLQAADSALKLADAYKKGAVLGNQIKTGLLTIGAAAATGLIAAYVALDQLIKKASDFQDMAETTGASAEGIASIAVAAATAGVQMDSVAQASIKLTKNLTGVDDESKAAGAALASLGINISDFKKLDPVGQFDAVGKALAGFADGAGKTVVATALYGKAGAEQLKVFKAVEEQGGRQIILTAEQIRQADEYADKQAKSRAQLMLYASAIATQATPALTAFTEVLTDVAKELLVVDKNAKRLAQGSSIADFAQESAISLAGTLDTIRNMADGVLLLGKSYAAAAAIISAASKGNFSEAASIRAAAKEDGEKLFGSDLQGRLIAKFESAKRDAANFDNEAIRRSTRGVKPELDFKGPTKKDGKGKDTAAQEAKAQLAYDIQQIKQSSDAYINTIANAQKIVEAKRAAGLVDEADYYASKLGFLNINNTAQEDALKKELARLQAEKLAGKDKIDNDRKIAETEAKLAKVREDSVTSLQLLGIQEASASKKLQQYYRDAEDAASDYLDTLRRAQGAELSGFGIGKQERARIGGRAQVEDKYTSQRQELDKSRRDAEFSGTFGPEAQKKYADELDRIRRFQATALGEYDAYFARRLAQEGNWTNGASEALQNYIDESKNVYKQTEEFFTNSLKGVEDALVNFITTGKGGFKSLADSIVAEITRIIVKQQMAAAIGGGDGGSGWLTGIAGSLIGAAFGTAGTATVASAMPGDSLDNFLKLNKNFGTGGRAIGGPVSAGGIYRVNEKGPELLNIAGDQYLMPGSQSGNVTPTSGKGGNTVNITVNQSFAPGTSRATTLQAAADARRQLEIAGRNL